jgi:tripartite-type tricarboxylate transporter receptor subunit TctC
MRAALYLAALLHVTAAISQPYPAKSVRIVVPAAPGGGTDVAARALAAQLGRSWDRQVVVDNRPSPAANIAAEVVSKAPADGYTLLLTTHALAINPLFNAKLPYDAARDFVPVGATMRAPLVLLVQPALAVKSVKELVALAAAQPDKLTYGHSGNGSADHVCGELFRRTAGIRVKSLPYKGALQPGTPVLFPELQYAFLEVVHAMPHAKAGQARALAVTTVKRYELLPNLPTVQETLPGFEFDGWQALFAPARTPPDVLRRIEAAVAEAIQNKALREALSTQGLQAVSMPPAEFQTFLRQEYARWAKLVREANVRIE